jgi:hypothetical protein
VFSRTSLAILRSLFSPPYLSANLTHVEIGSSSYRQRERLRHRALVASIWEELVGSPLSDERRELFMNRKQVDWLGDVPEDQLRRAATRSMGSNPNGHLLLAEWWHAAKIVREEEATAFRTQPQLRRKTEPEGPLVRCEACGTGIDYFSGRCGCQH